MPIGVGDWAGEMLVWAALIMGLIGSVIPLIPGIPLVFAGVLLHKLLFPDGISWWLVATMGVMVGLAVLVEWLGGLLGARAFGAGRAGMAGALVGGIIGLFFGLPGLILGPFAGAILSEALIARKPPAQAARAGIGVIVGIVGANVTHLLMALAMIFVFAWSAYF